MIFNIMPKKKITIDDLARMVQKGFDEVRGEVTSGFNKVRVEMVSKTEFQEFGKIVVDEFDRIRSDIRDIKTTLGPLVRIIADQEKMIQDFRFRIARLERKVGLTKD